MFYFDNNNKLAQIQKIYISNSNNPNISKVSKFPNLNKIHFNYSIFIFLDSEQTNTQNHNNYINITQIIQSLETQLIITEDIMIMNILHNLKTHTQNQYFINQLINQLVD